MKAQCDGIPIEAIVKFAPGEPNAEPVEDASLLRAGFVSLDFGEDPVSESWSSRPLFLMGVGLVGRLMRTVPVVPGVPMLPVDHFFSCPKLGRRPVLNNWSMASAVSDV